MTGWPRTAAVRHNLTVRSKGKTLWNVNRHYVRCENGQAACAGLLYGGIAMKIEYALSLCGPKSASSMFTCREAPPPSVYRAQDGGGPVSRARSGSTASRGSRDGYSEILLALGVVQSHEALGLSLILPSTTKMPQKSARR